MIDELTITRIKEAANVVDVVKDFVDLRRDGTADGNFEGLCPFHEDRNLGNFKVSRTRNYFKCFACGMSGGPIDFLMAHEKLSYPDALRWLGKKYGIEVEGADKFDVKKSEPHKPLPPLPMLEIPKDMMEAIREKGQNVLCQWIRNLPWTDEQRNRIDGALHNYCVGHGKDGHTIFWQIDEKGLIHTGKMMYYNVDGHRNKVLPSTWVHSRLERGGWYDPNKKKAYTCLFGLHLMHFCPEATVNIVESEKTALICAIAYGNMRRQIWMATGGMQFLHKRQLEPLIKAGRRIVLYPDKDGIEQWKIIANNIGYEHITVNDRFMADYWREEDGSKADIADILIRILRERTAGDSLDHPMVKLLQETFDLELIDIKKI